MVATLIQHGGDLNTRTRGDLKTGSQGKTPCDIALEANPPTDLSVIDLLCE